jgi:imidazolonepropionase-like amidohydrolase
LLVLLLAAPLSLAQPQQNQYEITWETAPNPDAILIRNADRIWTQGPEGILENASMLVRDGKIAEIGHGLSAPADALIIDATGMQVTPGIIDEHSHSGADAINEGTDSVTPEVRIEDVIDTSNLQYYRQLAGGLTTAHILHGSANSIGGQNAVIKLRYKADRPQDMFFEGAPPTLKLALGENVTRNPNRYPNTRMGVEQTIRNAFIEALDYKREWEEYNSLTEQEQERRVPPRTDLRLQALVEVLDGERVTHTHAYRQDEMLMMLRVAEEFGFQMGTFEHGLEGYKIAHEIAAHGAMVSSFSDWWGYKLEAYDAIPYNGAILHDAGVVVTFNSDNGDLSRRLNYEAAKAVRYGSVPEEEALDFVTINAAIQLGIEDRVGSLEVGKDADFVVWNGHPLSIYTRAEMTFLDGRKMFDREVDRLMHEAMEAERAALIAKVKGEEEGGAEGGEEESESGVPADYRDPAPGALVYRPSMLPDAGSIALVGGTIHPVTSETIENGVIVFSEGRISAVGGPGTTIPAGAERVDVSGKHVYPGLISANSVLGLTEIGAVDVSNDQSEMGDINANVRAEVAVNPESELIPVARGNGVLYAVTAPRGGLITGTSALLRLDGWTWEGLTAAAPVAMHVRFPSYRSGGRRFGGGRGGDQGGRQQEQIDTINAALDAARAYATAKQAEAEGGPWHATDPVLAALVPVIEGEVPLIVNTNGTRAIKEAVKWGTEQGLRIVLLDSGDAWRVADFLAEHEVPVIVDNVLTMPSRPDEPYDMAYTRAARLNEAGVQFAIASGGSGGDGTNVRNLPFHAGISAAFGLPKDEALRAVTIYPAMILGLDQDLGSIEVGKIASVVVTDGDILEIRSHVLEEYIDGRPVDLTSKHTELWEKYRDRPKPVMQR